MKMSMGNDHSSSHVIRWEHKDVNLVYRISFDSEFSDTFTVVRPAIVSVDYDRLAEKMIQQAGHGRLSRRHRKELMNLLYDTVPGNFTVGGS